MGRESGGGKHVRSVGRQRRGIGIGGGRSGFFEGCVEDYRG
jgi:hypothetical protein